MKKEMKKTIIPNLSYEESGEIEDCNEFQEIQEIIDNANEELLYMYDNEDLQIQLVLVGDLYEVVYDARLENLEYVVNFADEMNWRLLEMYEKYGIIK